VAASRLFEQRQEVVAIAAMMWLYFLVVLTVGILRPVRASLALDGLALGNFYRVYLISALVIAFVPLVNRLSDRFPWHRLIPGIALFFALNLIVFRSLYVEGSTTFGLAFYGWYDLFAAVLVTQFFMVTQLFFHARMAKNAYVLVIAAGALGATLGAGVSGFLAQRLGTPNLMLVAAIPTALFSLAVPLVWSLVQRETGRPLRPLPGAERPPGGRLRAIAADRQVQLIAGMVLIVVLVKQIVDYQFQTITKEVFIDRDAVTAFQGKFYAATQWLPLLALIGVKPLLRRWGVGLVVLIFPITMLLTNVGLVLFWSLWVAVAAKGGETALRYSVERTTREILYVPIPEELKLRAKNYIDAALERGVGKLVSGLVIGLVVGVIGLEYQNVAWVGGALAIVWVLMAIRVRREYVRALARAVNDRFASFRGAFADLDDPATVDAVRKSLQGDDPHIAFGLALVEQAGTEDGIRALAGELERLLRHPLPEIRVRALTLLTRAPNALPLDGLQACLEDPSAPVREAAVRALCDWQPGTDTVRRLLDMPSAAVRAAVLTCLLRGDVGADARDPDLRADLTARLEHLQNGSRDERIEQALLLAFLRPASASAELLRLIGDPDAMVASAAVWSAAMLGDPDLHPRLLAALGHPETRSSAREALIALGPDALPALIRGLLDEEWEPQVRRQIPSILARIPSPETVPALARCILAHQTDQILDHRAIKALSKLRAADPTLAFAATDVDAILVQCIEAGQQYADAERALGAWNGTGSGSAALKLLAQAAREARAERREEIFRCLGLRYEPADVHRAYLGVVRGETVPRANALEWLETTVGYRLFQRLEAVVDDHARNGAATNLPGLLERLVAGQDRWIAHLAAQTARDLGFQNGAPDRPNPKLSTTRPSRSPDMNLVETVLLLQQVDILRDARTDHLALVASIGEQMDLAEDTTLLRAGEPCDGLYVIVRGAVQLRGMADDLTLTDGGSFGTWSLIDDGPGMVEATVLRPTRLLRIGREDFHDLLTDHPELAIGMLQGLARRIRGLVA
jgi:ATP:ADP antiporter, AAA family